MKTKCLPLYSYRHVVQFDVVQVVNAPNYFDEPILWGVNVLGEQ